MRRKVSRGATTRCAGGWSGRTLALPPGNRSSKKKLRSSLADFHPLICSASCTTAAAASIQLMVENIGIGHSEIVGQIEGASLATIHLTSKHMSSLAETSNYIHFANFPSSHSTRRAWSLTIRLSLQECLQPISLKTNGEDILISFRCR